MKSCIRIFGVVLIAVLIASCTAEKKDISKPVYQLFSGSRGFVCWKISAERNENSADVWADICFPLEKKEVSRIKLASVGDTVTATSIVEAYRRVIQRGDRFLLITPVGGYNARNIYNGEVVESAKDIENKYPQLRADGVDKIGYYNYSDRFLAVKSKTDSTYFFDMESLIFYPVRFHSYVDSLIVASHCGIEFSMNSDATHRMSDTADIYFESLPYEGIVVPYHKKCLVMVNSENRTIAFVAPPYKNNDESAAISKFSQLLMPIGESEFRKLQVRMNNGIFTVSFNGKNKFVAAYKDLQTELMKVDPASYFEIPEVK